MHYAQTANIIMHPIASLERAASDLVRNVAASIEEANMRNAEREIARVLGGPDAKLTDESERMIAHLLQRGDW